MYCPCFMFVVKKSLSLFSHLFQMYLSDGDVNSRYSCISLLRLGKEVQNSEEEALPLPTVIYTRQLLSRFPRFVFSDAVYK